MFTKLIKPLYNRPQTKWYDHLLESLFIFKLFTFYFSLTLFYVEWSVVTRLIDITVLSLFTSRRSSYAIGYWTKPQMWIKREKKRNTDDLTRLLHSIIRTSTLQFKWAFELTRISNRIYIKEDKKQKYRGKITFSQFRYHSFFEMIAQLPIWYQFKRYNYRIKHELHSMVYVLSKVGQMAINTSVQVKSQTSRKQRWTDFFPQHLKS